MPVVNANVTSGCGHGDSEEEVLNFFKNYSTFVVVIRSMQSLFTESNHPSLFSEFNVICKYSSIVIVR